MKSFVVAVTGLVFALVSGVGSAQDKVNLSIGTGGTAGVYYPMGGGMAKILTKNVPGMQVTAEVTGGSVDNLKLIQTGKSEVGIAQADAVWDAWQGQNKFKDAKVPVRTLMVLFSTRNQLVTTGSTGIKKVTDLKGKRVSTGSPGSGTEIMAFRLLEAAGIDWDKDIKRERLGIGESVNSLKDGKIDAFFVAGGVPVAGVTDLAATPGVKLQLIDHADLVEAMNKKHGPLYMKDVIPPKSYMGQDAPNQNAGAWNLLVAHENLPEKVAYTIVKTLFENNPELITVHKEAQNIVLKNQTNSTTPIPFHPGAIRYFAERGITVR